MVLAEDVTGQENAWSEIEFSEPVASLSGTLFVILQYPTFYVPPEEGVSMGVGYREFDGENSYYISRDGDKWYRLSSNYDFLLNPIYVDAGSNVIAVPIEKSINQHPTRKSSTKDRKTPIYFT